MANTKKKKAVSAEAETAKEPAAEPEVKIVPKEIDLGQYVTVRNGFHGVLIYRSPRTGEIYQWDSFGAEQEMELRELKNAKSSAKSFYINNWFMFDEPWVVDYLGVGQYYRNAIGIDGFDKLFSKSPAEIRKLVKEMTPGQKKSMAYRASELISSGEIDSRKTIAALEDALGMELIEK